MSQRKIHSGIYCFECHVTGSKYIGQSRYLEERRNAHFKYLGRCEKHTKLDNFKNKYPNIEDWSFTIIEDNVPLDKLDEREIYWIKYYDTYKHGLNSSKGGDYNPMTDPIARKHVSDSVKMLGRILKFVKNGLKI